MHIYSHNCNYSYQDKNEAVCFKNSDPYSVLEKDTLIHCCILYMVRGWSNNFEVLAVFWSMISIFIKEENIKGHFWYMFVTYLWHLS